MYIYIYIYIYTDKPLQSAPSEMGGWEKYSKETTWEGALCPIPEPFAATVIGLSTTRLPVCGEHRLP